MKDGEPLMTFGNMGGRVQPETHAQHMVNLIDYGLVSPCTLKDSLRIVYDLEAGIS